MIVPTYGPKRRWTVPKMSKFLWHVMAIHDPKWHRNGIFVARWNRRRKPLPSGRKAR